MQPKLEARGNFREGHVRALTARQVAGDDTDVMTAFDLTVCEIKNMANNTADWRSDRMKNAKWGIWSLGHCQNQRSPTTTVSPGLRSVPGGTVT